MVCGRLCGYRIRKAAYGLYRIMGPVVASGFSRGTVRLYRARGINKLYRLPHIHAMHVHMPFKLTNDMHMHMHMCMCMCFMCMCTRASPSAS